MKLLIAVAGQYRTDEKGEAMEDNSIYTCCYICGGPIYKKTEYVTISTFKMKDDGKRLTPLIVDIPIYICMDCGVRNPWDEDRRLPYACHDCGHEFGAGDSLTQKISLLLHLAKDF